MALSAGTRSRDLPRSSAAACSLAFIAACGGSGGPKPAPESARAASDSAASSGACAVEAAPAVPAMHAVSAVQLGAFAERGRAEALRDSLARAGWEAYSRAATVDGRALTRVVVSPTSDAELARYVAAAFARTGREARVVRDSAEREAAADALMEVNRGTHGMAARVRWARSPDGCVLLAVEDPAAVEAEPVPNGFLLASERGGLVLRQDGVWDVAPSPDWRRLAYGLAYVAQGGAADTLSAAQWRDLARRVGLDVRVVRQAAFVVSDMGVAYGASRAAVVDIERAAASGVAGRSQSWRDSVTTLLPIAAGWRVRWSPDGSSVLLGAGPAHGRDDAPPRAWLAVDAQKFTPRGGPLPGSAAVAGEGAAPGVTAAWVEGPTIDVGMARDTAPPAPIAAGRRTVAARGGWITVSGGAGQQGVRVVGPGVPLAATAAGRFILALAPAPDTAQFVQPVRLVVYRLRE